MPRNYAALELHGRPARLVSCSMTAAGVGPASTKRSSMPPITRQLSRSAAGTMSIPFELSIKKPDAVPSASRKVHQTEPAHAILDIVLAPAGSRLHRFEARSCSAPGAAQHTARLA